VLDFTLAISDVAFFGRVKPKPDDHWTEFGGCVFIGEILIWSEAFSSELSLVTYEMELRVLWAIGKLALEAYFKLNFLLKPKSIVSSQGFIY
jgi:hypothetical protein